MALIKKSKNKIKKEEKRKKITKRIQKKSKTNEIDVNNSLLNLISPINLEFKNSSLTLGENLAKIFGIIKYPDRVDMGWLSKITNTPSTAVAVSIEPVEPSLLINVINKNIRQARIDLDSMDALVSQRAEKLIEDNELLMHQIDQNDETVIKAGVSIMAMAQNDEKLKNVVRKIEATCNLLRSKIRPLSFLQKEGLEQISGTYPINETVHTMTGKIMPLSTFVGGFPFSSTGLNDGVGYYFAKDKNGGLIVLDTWYRGEDRTNSNITVLGVAGTGKSTTVKHIITSEFMLGVKIIIVDPENEYSETTQMLGGDTINAGGSKKSKINILQIKPAPADEDDSADALYDENSALAMHIKNIEIFFKLYKKDFSDMHIAIIKRELIELYKSFGIEWDTNIDDFKNTDYPIISDLYNLIKSKEEDDAFDESTKKLYKELTLLLEDIAYGSDSFIFNGHTTINANSNIVCLNTSSIQSSSESVKKAQYFNILNWAWEKMSEDINQKVMLICDEAYLLIDPEVPQTAAFLRNVEKRCRKYEASLVIVSHSVVDFLDESIKQYGQALLDIPSMKIIFGADGKNLEEIDKLYSLTEAEKDLLEAKIRKNALFLVGNKRLHIKFDLPDYKFKYFGTRGGR